MITAGNNDTSFFCDLTYLLSLLQLNIIECEILSSNLFGYDFDYAIIRLLQIEVLMVYRMYLQYLNMTITALY